LNRIVDDDLENFGAGDGIKNYNGYQAEKHSRDQRVLHESPVTSTIFLLLFIAHGRDFLCHLVGAGISGVRALPAGKIGAACDEASAALVGEIRPCPRDKDQHAIAESD